MGLKQLKDEYPKMPDDIRAMIEREVGAQMETENPTVKNKVVKIPWKKSVAAALVAAMAFGTTVFAGVKLYQWYTEKEGAYGLKAGIEVNDSEKAAIPDEIPVLSMKANYLPEGMVAAEDGSFKYYHAETPYQGGISICPIAMDEKLSADQLPVSDTYVTFFEKLTIDGLDAVYLERQTEATGGISFDKKLYVAYPDYWQILEVFVGEDVSKEEAVKVIQNLELQPTGETQLLSETETWSAMINNEMEPEEAQGEKLTASKEEMKNTHQIGEAFPIETYASTAESEWVETDCVTAEITDVQVAEDFQLLDEECIDEDLMAALGEDGKLTRNEISYMKAGDGIDSLDSKIKAEEVGQKLLYATVEFTNTGTEELNEVLFFGTFVGLVDKGTGYEFYDRARMKEDGKADYVNYSSNGGFGEMDYYDVHGGERSNNYIPTIEPGETVQVHLAKIVNEDELGQMYLSLDTSGGCSEFTERALKIGYVDLRQS